MTPMHKPRSERKLGVAIAVCALPVLLFLTLHAAVMSRSQFLYYQAKYGSLRENDSFALTALDSARDLDEANYNVCEHAARLAWDCAARTTGAARNAMTEQSRLWCDRALILNPYQRSMRWMHAQQLAREDPGLGLAAWRAYVEWEFWEPENHLILAELALNAHCLEIAEQALRWAQGAPGYAAMAERIKQERERAAPPPRAENGVGNGVRTRDIQNHNLALYQLSYTHRRENSV